MRRLETVLAKYTFNKEKAVMDVALELWTLPDDTFL